MATEPRVLNTNTLTIYRLPFTTYQTKVRYSITPILLYSKQPPLPKASQLTITDLNVLLITYLPYLLQGNIVFIADREGYKQSRRARAARRIYVHHMVNVAKLKGTVLEKETENPISDARILVWPLVSGGYTTTDEKGFWSTEIPGGRG